MYIYGNKICLNCKIRLHVCAETNSPFSFRKISTWSRTLGQGLSLYQTTQFFTSPVESFSRRQFKCELNIALGRV